MGESGLIQAASFSKKFRLDGFAVALYHGVGDPAKYGIPSRERKYWVSRNQFERQLRVINELGCRVHPLHEAWRANPAAEGSARLTALTFDDGRVSDYEAAFPSLCVRRYLADFFINPSNVGKPGYMNWRQIVEMASAGMSFHSHGMHHVDLSSLSAAKLRVELVSSKAEIEARVGKPVRYLGAPYGLLNREVLRVAVEEGYQAVCSSRNWPAWPGALEVPRAAVFVNTDDDEFRRLIARHPYHYLARSARSALLHWPKRLLLKTRPEALTVHKLKEAA